MSTTNMSTEYASRLFTIHRFPIRYLVIPKCGCTYTKNLLWQIEHGARYVNPARIHDRDSAFIRASDLNLGVADILNEQYAFTIIRNPVDRFFSLYSDKVIGLGHLMYVPLRAILQKKYSLNIAPETVADHTRNCEILIEWIEENLKSRVDLERESHWTPQSDRLDIIRAFNLKLLILKDLNTHLVTLLGDLVPSISSTLNSIETNRSIRIFPKEQVLTKSIRRKINYVYGKDRQIFERTRDAWGESGIHSMGIPRAQILSDL